MHKTFLIEVLFAVLAIAFVVTAIRYPKQVFITLPLSIIKYPFQRLWNSITVIRSLLAFALTYFGNNSSL